MPATPTSSGRRAPLTLWEVAQVAEEIARDLASGDDDFVTLVRTAALVHDLGHPPFGHNGERALKEWATAHGASFEANAQSFRIVTNLESKYPLDETDREVQVGLNLTRATLQSTLKSSLDAR